MTDLAPLRDRLGPEFQPFTIRLTDGRSFGIPRRDFIAVGRRVISIIDDRDVAHTIDPLHIVSLEDKIAQNGS
jgi:hypothetical protein